MTVAASDFASPTRATGLCVAFAPPHDLARRSAEALEPEELDAIEAAVPALMQLVEDRADDARLRATSAHVPQPSPAPQLPHLLHRAARVARRDVDAERRSRLARHRALRLALAIGALAFWRFVPFTVFGLVAGVVADRIESRKLVMATQARAMAISIALAVVTLTGTATLPIVYVLAALGGVALAFDAPGRQSLTFQMVGPRELPNAVALNSGLFNGSRVIGPAIAGLVIAAVGTGLLRPERLQLPRGADRARDRPRGGAPSGRAGPRRDDRRRNPAGDRLRWNDPSCD